MFWWKKLLLFNFRIICLGTLRKFLDMIAIEISQSTSTVAPKTPSEGKKENLLGTRLLQ
jgi:hypothetical protein